MMENHPANIFLAAVLSLVVASGLMMGVFFLDFVLCDGKCLVPETDIEEAQRTIIYLTDDQDLERM
jgi:small ligand-binding sensory domain FIST